MGWSTMARTFAQKKILAILGLALVLAPVKFPTVTNDKLLTAVFGGFFWEWVLAWQCAEETLLTEQKVLAIYLSIKTGAGWDGNYMGEPSPSGGYACRIELLGTDKTRQIHTGNITLLH